MGGRTPVAAIWHGVIVLLLLLAAAPLVASVPMAVLGGILAVVAWNMSERHRFRQILRMPVADAGVMLATFALTVLVSLTVAVQVGMVLAAAFFLARMAKATTVDLIDPTSDPRYRQRTMEGRDVPEGCLVYSIDGPFFFGAADRFREVVDRVAAKPKVVIFRMRHVPYVDATGLNSLETAVDHLQKKGTHVILSAVQNQPLDMMMRGGFLGRFHERDIQTNIDAALERAREILGVPPSPAPSAGGPAGGVPQSE
jgi:SulP family sulfate permease